MIKTSKNQKLSSAAKLRINHETLRIIGSQELIAAVGGASGGVSGIPGVTPNSRDIACCAF